MKTLDSLGALFADARDAVLRLGRAGGAILLGFAAGAGAGAAWAFALASAREERLQLYRVTELRILGGLLVALAVALLVAGFALVLRPRPPTRAFPALSPDELLTLARGTPRPFHVCVRCRRVWGPTESVGRCPQCDSAADCLEVRGDADLAMVEAAIK